MKGRKRSVCVCVCTWRMLTHAHSHNHTHTYTITHTFTLTRPRTHSPSRYNCQFFGGEFDCRGNTFTCSLAVRGEVVDTSPN